MKKSITSLELTALVNELQFLKGGKVSQIYHQEKKELLFQLHARGQGKKLLKIVSGKYLCLSEKKSTPLKPSSFCMQLRKYLSNASINDIYQKDSQRIVVFELEKKEKYYLILELFSKGNLILTDQKYNIIGNLEHQRWKDRIIKVKEIYQFPVSEINWKKISEKKVIEILRNSVKKNLAIALATEIGLGGLYAEEICHRNEIDKNKLPPEITGKEVKQIAQTLKEFLQLVENPSGYLYEEQISPFPLSDPELKVIKETKTYSEAIDTLNPFQIISPYEKRIRALTKMNQDQKEAILKQERRIELNKKKGEIIYEKYQPLQKLLDFVSSARKKGQEWKDIETELKKVKKIKKVDLKNKKIIVDL